MDIEIVKNLTEYWEFVGNEHGLLIDHGLYRSISIAGSTWPHRLFSVDTGNGVLKEIIERCTNGEIPNIIMVHRPNALEESRHLELMFSQLNMALAVSTLTKMSYTDPGIQMVTNNSLVNEFAQVATESFGNAISADILAPLIQYPEKVQLYIYEEGDTTLGCGALFIDSNNNAGFHTIGTVPAARGKGIAKKITEHLIQVALDKNVRSCVLHASPMGKNIYAQLGFKSYGEIATYRIF